MRGSFIESQACSHGGQDQSFLICVIPTCPPEWCWLSAVLPEWQGLGDTLNESLEQYMTLKSCSNTVVTWAAGHPSYLISWLVSIIHSVARVSSWGFCPDPLWLTVQNSNTPGPDRPMGKLSFQSHPMAKKKDLKYDIIGFPSAVYIYRQTIHINTRLIHRKHMLDDTPMQSGTHHRVTNQGSWPS